MPKGYHVKSVYLDEKTGVIAAKPGKGGKLFFEMSTIEIEITQEVGKAVMDAGFGTYFDSPISVTPNPPTQSDHLSRAVSPAPKTAPSPT